MKDEKRIKIDDNVTIDNPEFVYRVGYPIGVQEGIDMIITDHRDDLEEFLDKIGIPLELNSRDAPKLCVEALRKKAKRAPRDTMDLLRKLGYMKARAMGFGGPERTLHTIRGPEWLVGIRATVVDTKIKKTGTRCSGNAGYADPWYEDYEPPSLYDQVTHKLLRIEYEDGGDGYLRYTNRYYRIDQSMEIFGTPDFFASKDHGKYGLWIDSSNVTKIEEPQ